MAGDRFVYFRDRFRQPGTGLKLGNRNRKTVSSAWHGLDQTALCIAKLIAELSDALHKRIVRHEDIRPHRFDKLIFRDKPPCILGEVAQYENTFRLCYLRGPAGIIVAAAEVGLALGIILQVFRNRQTANVDEVDTLKW